MELIETIWLTNLSAFLILLILDFKYDFTRQCRILELIMTSWLFITVMTTLYGLLVGFIQLANSTKPLIGGY